MTITQVISGRNLSHCINEHRKAVRKLVTFSGAMSEHVYQMGHSHSKSIYLGSPPLPLAELSYSLGTSITNVPPSTVRRSLFLVLTYLTLRFNCYVK